MLEGHCSARYKGSYSGRMGGGGVRSGECDIINTAPLETHFSWAVFFGSYLGNRLVKFKISMFV
jgi:hypothetical protein